MGLTVLSESRLLKKTTGRCHVCLREIPAEVAEVDGRVVMRKRCPEHGPAEVVLSRHPRFYHVSSGEPANACCGSSCGCAAPAAGAVSDGATARDPFEVLSTCLALIEIVDSCNLACPTCFASSPRVGAEAGGVACTPLTEVRSRVEGVIARKGFIDVLQLSGGEPTLHPEFFEILDWALSHPGIGYVMINTNGVRIAGDRGFREQLGRAHAARKRFELYLQFDGVQEAGQRDLRGADLRETRRLAIDGAGEMGVPTTLAMTVTPANIGCLGEAIAFGLARPHCRGLTLQPRFVSGRVGEDARGPGRDTSLPLAASAPEPISVGDLIVAMCAQCAWLREEDFTPLPCGDPNCHTMGYLLRMPEGPVGLSRLIDVSSMKTFLRDRVDYRLEDLAKCGCESEPLGQVLRSIELGPQSPFRIFIKPFMDARTFDQDRIDRCCTHVIRPDGKLDSFCRYYLLGGAPGLGLKAGGRA